MVQTDEYSKGNIVINDTLCMNKQGVASYILVMAAFGADVDAFTATPMSKQVKANKALLKVGRTRIDKAAGREAIAPPTQGYSELNKSLARKHEILVISPDPRLTTRPTTRPPHDPPHDPLVSV